MKFGVVSDIDEEEEFKKRVIWMMHLENGSVDGCYIPSNPTRI